MSEENKVLKAQGIYKSVCEMFDSFGLEYDRKDEILMATCTINGDDIPVTVNMQVDAKKEMVYALSYIPIEIPEEKRIDMAIAASVTNGKLVDGSFDFDIKQGNLFFRITNCYIDSDIGIETLKYMFICAAKTIEDFNDKFLMLVKGELKIDYFLQEHD